MLDEEGDWAVTWWLGWKSSVLRRGEYEVGCGGSATGPKGHRSGTVGRSRPGRSGFYRQPTEGSEGRCWKTWHGLLVRFETLTPGHGRGHRVVSWGHRRREAPSGRRSCRRSAIQRPISTEKTTTVMTSPAAFSMRLLPVGELPFADRNEQPSCQPTIAMIHVGERWKVPDFTGCHRRMTAVRAWQGAPGCRKGYGPYLS